MDRTGRLFSRGGSPPLGGSLQMPGPVQQQAPPPQQDSAPTQSAPQHLDSLFRNIGMPQPPPQYAQQQPNTASSTPLSTSGISSNQGPGTAASNERQSALLSTLMGSVVPQQAQSPPHAAPGYAIQQQPQHRPPSPHGSVPLQRSMQPQENQGQMLLEQLMAGTTPQTSSLPQPPIVQESRIAHPIPSIPTPTNLTPDLERGLHPPSLPPSPPQEPAHRSAPQPPSPTRKSMFEFVSPFDAFGPQSSATKKKPVPPINPGSGGLSSGNEDPPSPVGVTDPRRKSVDNLLQDTAKNPAPLPQPQYTESKPKEQRMPEPSMARSPPQAPQKASLGSPRSSPPRAFAQRAPGAGAPLGTIPSAPTGRERDDGPATRGGQHNPQWKQGKPAPARGKNTAPVTPPVPSQTILFDVSQPMEATLASNDLVKSTAIALLKIEPAFVPGCTIGVTTWIAYAMTRGRVRIIGRANGERTLLQLPPLFQATTTVIDMVVFGNRLAAVTSDGGFVIWEVPRIVEDDVPAKLLLCVAPPQEGAPLTVVKWHPKQPDTLAVGSDKEIYLINVLDAINVFDGGPISQAELPRIGTVFSLVSPLVSFAFDVANYAIVSISEDSTLTAWSTMDKLPAWSNKIVGDGEPSSIDVLEGGIVIGRKQGTVLQLLPVYSKEVVATVKFVNGSQEDPDMFGHVSYDQRIRTLWVANSRRESLIALRVAFETIHSPDGKQDVQTGHFEQLVEFPGLRPTIHFVILSADADPNGEEAEAACVAAKLAPGELALVAYSVHAHGVDQVLIRKEWFESALWAPSTRLPIANTPTAPLQPQARQQQQQPPSQMNQMRQVQRGSSPSSSDNKPASQTGPSSAPHHHQQHQLHHPMPIPLHQNPLAQHPAPEILPPRPRTPPSDDLEADVGGASESRFTEVKAKGPMKAKDGPGKDKGKQKDVDNTDKDKDKQTKGAENSTSSVNDALAKEIRKVEESLHTRIGRLIGKELDKQQQRLEELRAAEQAADFARQEKILKLISTELTKNTTRVVEAAVKTVVQNSVLPSLETITKNEVKAALNGQIAKGLADSMNQTLPIEIERLLLRPDVANHVARTFSSTVTPLIERHVKEAITKTLIPAYLQQSDAMHQDISRELHAEILNVKKEIITWQSEALKGQESLIRDMEQTIKGLSEQVKFLSMNLTPAGPYHHPAHRSSPGTSGQQHPQGHGQVPQHMRQPVMPPPPPQNYPMAQGQYAPPPPPMNATWFNNNVLPHPGSHQQQGPPPQAPVRDGPSQEDDWDEVYLRVLGLQDSRQLRELLGRSNPDVVMPLNSAGPLSQAVILTLIHRIAAAVGEISTVDEFFKSGMWWMQRAISVLNANDPLISPYVGRVLPSVQGMLQTTRQRLNILPVPPSLETTRTITELQEMIGRKL